MRITELFKEGTEPTEISNRYQKLENPTDGKYTLDGNTVTLSWTGINTPKAIDTNYLQEYYNDYFGQFASKYYEERITDNTNIFGIQGYQVYLRDSESNLTNLSWVENTSYTQTLEPGKTYTFVIKSSYQIFKDNESEGLTISVKVNSPEPSTPDTEENITVPPEPTPEPDDSNVGLD